VIAIDQDPAGRQGFRVSKEGGGEVWIKPLQNGDLALGLFNRGEVMTTVVAYWEIIGIKGKHKVHDVWSHEDLGAFKDGYSADVSPHGVILVRIAR
jgi:alpha-galactosidase